MSRKAISFALTALMLVALVAGCSGPAPSTSTPASQAPVASASVAPSSDASAAPANPPVAPTSGFAGYPMTNGQTISWFVSNGFIPNAKFATADESPFHKILQEMTGVKIEWQFPTQGTDAAQAFNLMLSSETLPDIFYHGVMADADRYITEGTIRDLTSVMEKNSPAYYALLKSKPIYDQSFKTDSGKYYGYGFFREDGGWNDTYMGPVVRQDWLDAVGLQAPKTISDWTNVIKAFKDKYNAKLSFAWSRFNGAGAGICGAFGAFTTINANVYVDDSGKVQYAHAQPEWKALMTQLHQWWADGLIDQDVLTLTDKDEQTKALNGLVGISYTSMGQVSNWEKDATTANNGAKWVGLQYPTGDDGKLTKVFGGYGVGDQVSVITTACSDDKLETAMRLLDYAYTADGSLYWNFGKQGNSWDYDADHKPAYTKLVTDDADGLNNSIDKYGGATWSGSCVQATLLLYLKNTKTAIAADDLWFYPNEKVTAKNNLPRVSYTSAESNRLQELNSTINTYITEMSTKFLTGEESLEKYDDFVKQLKTMGLDEVLSINQAAYDRFQKR